MATFRQAYGVGLWDAGAGYLLGEAVTLASAAVSDTSTRLGAAVAGWGYPASITELFALAVQAGKQGFNRIAPWSTGFANTPEATQDELDQATADLDAMVHFS